MLLAIDVGNTNITLGLFRGQKLIRELRIKTAGFKRLPKLCWPQIERTIITSVVPEVDRKLKKCLPRPYRFITAQNVPFIKVKIKNKREVGSDRLVNAAAGHKLYGGPLIIIDFGTASTFCAVTAKGEYLGGIIAPGIDLSRRVLHEKTAKLPLIELQKPAKVIGDSTLTAMRSGIVLGYVAMVEGLLKMMKAELRWKFEQKHIKVLATGGYAGLINSVLRNKMKVDPQLILKGLRLISKEVF